jgi:hypothetical protein
MACNEIDQAFAWAKSSGSESHPVIAYFTKHEGILADPNNPKKDYCWYAVGQVQLNPAGHLAGDLDLYLNSGVPTKTQPGGESMHLPANSTLGLELFPNGSFNYQQKINGKPLGANVKVSTTTCIGGVLLMGTEADAVVAVGVRRDPPFINPK